MQSEGKRADLSVPIEERFTLEARLAYSLSGQVFKAIDRASRTSVAIWISRRPLSPDAVDSFLRRVEQLCSVSGQPQVLAFGLDPMRHGWFSLRLFSGRHILEGRVDRREAERRWLGCVRAIERMHKAGIACGDVCLESFLLTSSGEVRFLGGLGVLASGSELFTAAPLEEAQELHLYLAPEQGEEPSCSMMTDVFALARLSYRFFSGRPLAETVRSLEKRAHTNFPPLDRAPSWFNPAVLPILSCIAEDRPQNATALMQAILRERSEVLVDVPRRPGPAAKDVDSESPVLDLMTPPRASKTGTSLLVALAVLTGLLVGLSVVQPARLTRLFGAGASAVASIAEIQALAASDDPMAHESLLRFAADARDAVERREILQLTTERSRRLGLIRSSDLVRDWLLRGSSSTLVAGNAPLALKVLNPSLSDGARVELLQQGYLDDRLGAAQLAAALGLDMQKLESFRPLYSNAAKEFVRSPEPMEQSTVAIMAAAPPIRSLYLTELLEAKELSPSDTQWLLERLREQGEANVKPVVALGLRNGTFVGPRRVFAEALAAPSALSTRDRIVFFACLVSEPSRAGAAALVSSYNPYTARALLALVWLSNDPDVRATAMDGLFAKPLGDPTLQRVVDFVESRKPEERDRYSRVLAAAGLSDLLTDSEFSSGFAILQQGSLEPELLSALLQRAPARLVFEVLAASGNNLQANVYLDLLKHPSKDVRLEALKRLRSFNDATMYALLRQMYEDERDEDVRQEYRAFLGS